ncbi:hypothetical protein C5E41_07520 [Nocardia nova]|nr:hypothetical protein C5E41_07520 [Nocardia nova]
MGDKPSICSLTSGHDTPLRPRRQNGTTHEKDLSTHRHHLGSRVDPRGRLRHNRAGGNSGTEPGDNSFDRRTRRGLLHLSTGPAGTPDHPGAKPVDGDRSRIRPGGRRSCRRRIQRGHVGTGCASYCSARHGDRRRSRSCPRLQRIPGASGLRSGAVSKKVTGLAVRPIVFGAIAVVAIAGCADSSDRADTATSASHSSTPSPTPRRGEISDQDRVFISQLSDYWLRSVDRADLIEAGEVACRRMRGGEKLQVIAQLADGTIDGNSVRADATKLEHTADFLHAASTAYCPDQLSGVK